MHLLNEREVIMHRKKDFEVWKKRIKKLAKSWFPYIFNWFICEMLNLTKMCQPNWEYANVIVPIQMNKYECLIIEHGWFKRSMQDNIKINAINA
jgi:hypothetical protein